MRYVVERIVDEEAQFGYYPQLVAHACAQFVAYGLLVRRNVLYQLVGLFRGEYAQVGRADAQVGTDAAARNAHHDAAHRARLRLEYQAELLLKQPGYAVLSCFLHFIVTFVYFFE